MARASVNQGSAQVPSAAHDLCGLPDAARVRGLAADVLDPGADVLEAAEGGEERHLRRARLRDVRALARDRRVADAVELHVPADDLDVHVDARFCSNGLTRASMSGLGLGPLGMIHSRTSPPSLAVSPPCWYCRCPVVTAGHEADGQREDGRDQ